MNQHKIAPSLLAADFGNLQRDIEMINQSDADWLHLDVMDGVFVPNLSIGFPILNVARTFSKKPLDVHLMIVQPEKFIPRLEKYQINTLSVHYETCTHLHSVVQQIKNAGMKASVTLNPHSPVCLLEDILQDLDMALLMSVNPGFGGQQFITQSVQKVAKLKEMILRKNAATLIEVDGGITCETGKLLLDAGADVLVAGSFVFKSNNPLETIHKLKCINELDADSKINKNYTR
ncbi:MAG: ribulose-phosphate 3-epimerase [Bacteroidales bacterium]|jgi:ribulose-phosphate 3-epimerase|nr:ribulose-phosphate 3-epimerase [Bacteroidales bacterium]